ncbi:hypothetical protein D3C78_1287130 [compost metagenome]
MLTSFVVTYNYMKPLSLHVGIDQKPRRSWREAVPARPFGRLGLVQNLQLLCHCLFLFLKIVDQLFGTTTELSKLGSLRENLCIHILHFETPSNFLATPPTYLLIWATGIAI